MLSWSFFLNFFDCSSFLVNFDIFSSCCVEKEARRGKKEREESRTQISEKSLICSDVCVYTICSECCESSWDSGWCDVIPSRVEFEFTVHSRKSVCVEAVNWLMLLLMLLMLIMLNGMLTVCAKWKNCTTSRRFFAHWRAQSKQKRQPASSKQPRKHATK